MPMQSEIVLVHRNSSTLVASQCPLTSMLKAESNNCNVAIFLTSIVQPKKDPLPPGRRLDQDWEFISVDQIKDWSAGLDTFQVDTVQDTHCSIPGYGESSIRFERANGTVHLFVRPFSNNEISAKDVRSRIADTSRSSTPDPDKEYCVSPSSASDFSHVSEDEKTFCTVQSPQSNISSRTHYLSALEDAHCKIFSDFYFGPRASVNGRSFKSKSSWCSWDFS